MIARKSLLSELRRLGFSFEQRTKRVEFWHKKGTTYRLPLPTHVLFSEEAARDILRLVGAFPADIDKFIQEHGMEK